MLALALATTLKICEPPPSPLLCRLAKPTGLTPTISLWSQTKVLCQRLHECRTSFPHFWKKPGGLRIEQPLPQQMWKMDKTQLLFQSSSIIETTDIMTNCFLWQFKNALIISKMCAATEISLVILVILLFPNSVTISEKPCTTLISGSPYQKVSNMPSWWVKSCMGSHTTVPSVQLHLLRYHQSLSIWQKRFTQKSPVLRDI